MITHILKGICSGFRENCFASKKKKKKKKKKIDKKCHIGKPRSSLTPWK